MKLIIDCEEDFGLISENDVYFEAFTDVIGTASKNYLYGKNSFLKNINSRDLTILEIYVKKKELLEFLNKIELYIRKRIK